MISLIKSKIIALHSQYAQATHHILNSNNTLFASSTIAKTGNSVTDKTRVQRSHSKLIITITPSH